MGKQSIKQKRTLGPRGAPRPPVGSQDYQSQSVYSGNSSASPDNVVHRRGSAATTGAGPTVLPRRPSFGSAPNVFSNPFSSNQGPPLEISGSSDKQASIRSSSPLRLRSASPSRYQDSPSRRPVTQEYNSRLPPNRSSTPISSEEEDRLNNSNSPQKSRELSREATLDTVVESALSSVQGFSQNEMGRPSLSRQNSRNRNELVQGDSESFSQNEMGRPSLSRQNSRNRNELVQVDSHNDHFNNGYDYNKHGHPQNYESQFDCLDPASSSVQTSNFGVFEGEANFEIDEDRTNTEIPALEIEFPVSHIESSAINATPVSNMTSFLDPKFAQEESDGGNGPKEESPEERGDGAEKRPRAPRRRSKADQKPRAPTNGYGFTDVINDHNNDDVAAKLASKTIVNRPLQLTTTSAMMATRVNNFRPPHKQMDDMRKLSGAIASVLSDCSSSLNSESISADQKPRAPTNGYGFTDVIIDENNDDAAAKLASKTIGNRPPSAMMGTRVNSFRSPHKQIGDMRKLSGAIASVLSDCSSSLDSESIGNASASSHLDEIDTSSTARSIATKSIRSGMSTNSSSSSSLDSKSIGNASASSHLDEMDTSSTARSIATKSIRSRMSTNNSGGGDRNNDNSEITAEARFFQRDEDFGSLGSTEVMSPEKEMVDDSRKTNINFGKNSESTISSSKQRYKNIMEEAQSQKNQQYQHHQCHYGNVEPIRADSEDLYVR